MGQRIVMLKGMGEVHHSVDSSRVSSTVGINIVSPVARIEVSRLDRQYVRYSAVTGSAILQHHDPGGPG